MCIVLTLTSWVDVAVLPIDFNHEITWTEHLFANYLQSIIFSQLSPANYIQSMHLTMILSGWELFHLWMQVIGGLALRIQLCS